MGKMITAMRTMFVHGRIEVASNQRLHRIPHPRRVRNPVRRDVGAQYIDRGPRRCVVTEEDGEKEDKEDSE